MQGIRIGINGLGRIGKQVARMALARPEFEIKAINDSGPPESFIHRFRYDSVHGSFPMKELRVENGTFKAGSQIITLFSERDPMKLPWGDLGVDVVLECTGSLNRYDKAALHLQQGAKKVILSAPSPDPDMTIVMGVNQGQYKTSLHHIVSSGSCTTHCLAPIAKVLDEEFEILKGSILTVHSYTNDQRVLDGSHSDPRRARASQLSMIPTTTGAAKTLGLILPQLQGKLDGLAIRVPTPNVSLLDLSCEVKSSTSVEAINSVFKKASQEKLKGILGYSTEPLVSCDYNHNPMSATVDASLTRVIQENHIKVIAWYDNETGFSARMLDLCVFMAQEMNKA